MKKAMSDKGPRTSPGKIQNLHMGERMSKGNREGTVEEIPHHLR